MSGKASNLVDGVSPTHFVFVISVALMTLFVLFVVPLMIEAHNEALARNKWRQATQDAYVLR